MNKLVFELDAPRWTKSIFSPKLLNIGPKQTFYAFIDMAKAYDKVWRVCLWYKLWKYGIRGEFYREYISKLSQVIVGRPPAGAPNCPSAPRAKFGRGPWGAPEHPPIPGLKI